MAGVVERVRSEVARELAGHARVVLAVSGGADSMALLDAAAAVSRGRIACVATFDHGTGAHAREAAALVERTARRLGIPLESGRRALPAAGDGEAEWRTARWRFLRHVARRHDARVATAHTRDDQVETVLMRAMRGAGPRGLAGLFAEGGVLRPLLAATREDTLAYVNERGLETVDDPGNRSRAHLRNRIRLDLLPAMRAVRPSFEVELLGIAREASAWRREVEDVARSIGATEGGDGSLHVALPSVTGYSPEALGALWPALAARVGATLDRRGTVRLVEFTRRGRSGRSIPLAGGFEIVRRQDELVVRRTAPRVPAGLEARSLKGIVRLGAWRLRPTARSGDDAWTAELPAGRSLVVRPWQPGDRMRGEGRATARRVKRWLADARVPADRRAGWPVVLADDEIVWIPGVRRGHAATDRSGRPGLSYVCERNDHG